jgi:hypothetical protein
MSSENPIESSHPTQDQSPNQNDTHIPDNELNGSHSDS